VRAKGRKLAACVAVWLAIAPATATAQSNAAQQALDLAYEADALFARGKWEEAHDRFSKADALAHSPVFVLYMARSRRNAGKLLEAAKLYSRVAGEKLEKKAPAPFHAAIADAAAELADVEAKTPRVRVEVRGAEPKDIDVTVDSKPIAVGQSVAMDPGAHAFVARVRGVEGAAERKQSVSLVEGQEEVVVDLDFSPDAAPKEPLRPERGPIGPGLVLMVIGGIGLELGVVSGAIAAKTSGDVKDGCIDNHCLREDADALDRARTLGTVSTVAFVAGGALVATGVVLLAVRPGGSSAPSVTASPGALWIRGAF
jgi:hypothetical protein